MSEERLWLAKMKIEMLSQIKLFGKGGKKGE